MMHWWYRPDSKHLARCTGCGVIKTDENLYDECTASAIAQRGGKPMQIRGTGYVVELSRDVVPEGKDTDSYVTGRLRTKLVLTLRLPIPAWFGVWLVNRHVKHQCGQP